jgi:hypothetical protein
LDAVGELFGPAVPARSGEGDQLLTGGLGEFVVGGPACQQLEDGRRGQVVAGHLHRGREGRQQVLAESVEQAALVTGVALVVAGDRAQLGGQGAVGDERPQGRVAVNLVRYRRLVGRSSKPLPSCHGFRGSL